MALKTWHFLGAFLLLCCIASAQETIESLTQKINDLSDKIDHKEKVISQLGRQVLLQEDYAQARIRVEGDSGVAQVKNYQVGSVNFESFSHTGEGPMAMHDHAAYRGMVGYGRFTAVVNGVQFTTRHTDVMLNRASTTSSDWHSVDSIPFPPVPESVKAKETLEEEMDEMAEYFRAFKEQNVSHRDYRDYFKPVLCYLEGAWLSDVNKIEAPSEYKQYSRNMEYNAYEWSDMAEQNRLQEYLGSEMFATHRVAGLPRIITGINTTTQEPIYAQWHYRILCHPISRDVPTKFFRKKEEVSYKMRYPDEFSHLAKWNMGDCYSRGAMFTLDELDEPGVHERPTLLDRIISEIPGKDQNIAGELSENDYLSLETQDPNDKTNGLNLRYYNHVYWISRSDSMNREFQIRGQSDQYLYMALNNRSEVANLPITWRQKGKPNKWTVVKDLRASWMIPLEIIYLTPTDQWNPLNHTVLATKPVGKGVSLSDPLRAVYETAFYQTPRDFYDYFDVPNKLKADGFGSARRVNSTGVSGKMIASGIFTITPRIRRGVGYVRTRYPIAPLHFEGSALWKEFNAYKAFLADNVYDISETMNYLEPLTYVPA